MILFSGTLELHVYADNIFNLIFESLIGMMHIIYRWIRIEISHIFLCSLFFQIIYFFK
jgi:hypothetical protein